mmetsp:Transcript_58889/g.155100  ORF Transcript_58889/g.155100 Transcript_58889/m.155100 type:complete len:719 (-) Transcript_58889:350-2506(-)
MLSTLAKGFDLCPHNGDRVFLEAGSDLRHDHGDILGQRDEEHRARVVQVIAEADLVAHGNADQRDVQPGAGRALRRPAGRHALALRRPREPLILGVLVANAVLHSLVHGGEEPLLANELLQVGLAHCLVDTVPSHCECRLDAAAPEVADDVLDDVDGRRVHADDGRHLQDHVLRLVHFLEVVHVGQQHVLDEGRVREVERGADAADEDVGDEGSAALLLHVAVDGRARDAPEDRDLGADRLVDHDDQGEADGHGDAHEHTQEEGADEGHDPEHEIMPLDAQELLGLAECHQRNHGAHHDDRESELGQVVEERGQEEEREEHEDRRDEARELRAGARVVVHRRAREAAGDRVAGEDRAHQVRDTEGEHLLPGLDLVAVLRREVLADGDGLHVADEAGGQGGRQDPRDLAHLPRRPAHRHEALGDFADVLDVVILVEARNRDHHERADGAGYQGPQRADPPKPLPLPGAMLVHEEVGEENAAQQKRHSLSLVNVHGKEPQRLIDVLRLRDVIAQDVLQLAEADDDGRSAGEPARHGMSQEGHEEAELQDASDNLHDAHHASRQRGQARVRDRANFILSPPRGFASHLVPLGALFLDELAAQTGLDEQRDHGHRADRQLSRLAEDGVHDQRNAGGVHPIDVREARDACVRHALRNHHDPDGDARKQVSLEGGPLHLWKPGRDRHHVQRQSQDRMHGVHVLWSSSACLRFSVDPRVWVSAHV